MDAMQEQLERHEGRRAKPYMDTVGKITIGIGRNLSDKGLSDDEIDYLYQNDIKEVIEDCATFPWFGTLNPVRQRVVLDMRFNLGAAGLREFKRFLRMLEQENYTKAADAMRNSLWAQQVKSRADRLIAMMRTGEVI